jgi:uncharacterized protein (TIGR03435 family)
MRSGSLASGRRLFWKSAGIAAVAAPAFAAILSASQSQTQSPAASSSKFEVASIRLGCASGDSGGRGQTKSGGGDEGRSPDRLNVCGTLRLFIAIAYIEFADGRTRPPDARIPALSGGPSWINSDRYQINAKAEGPQSQGTMRGPMLRALLEDRFKLKIHRETKEVPVYALTVAKGGLKLQRVETCTPVDHTNRPPPPEPGQEPPKSSGFCDSLFFGNKGMNRTLDMHAMSMKEFAQSLGVLDRPVIDKTGISGMFDFHLEFAPDERTPNFLPLPDSDPAGTAGATPAGSGPSIFTAMQQLGLRLEPAKGPDEFLVIDHVEKPSEN